MKAGKKVYWEGKVKEKAIEQILDRISKGESVNHILSKDRDKKKLPNKETFYGWCREDAILDYRYARATELRAELIFEDILLIADDSSNDKKTIIVNGKKVETINKEAIQRSRVRIDARKWMLSKILPKRYGRKIDITTDGEKINQESKINLKINGTDIKLE